MIHAADPETNFYPMYSVEYTPRGWHQPQAWDQFALTHSKWFARFLAVENWLRHHKRNRTRVRVL